MQIRFFFKNCIDFNSKFYAILRNKKNSCMIKTKCVVTMISCLLLLSVFVAKIQCVVNPASDLVSLGTVVLALGCKITLISLSLNLLSCAGMWTLLPAQCAVIKPLLVHVGSNQSYLFSIGYRHAADLQNVWVKWVNEYMTIVKNDLLLLC